MEIDNLIAFLRTIIPVNASLEAAIREQVILVRYRRGQIIVSPDRRADQLWFISKGLAKEYYFDASGKMVITAFWKENELMVAADSLFSKKRTEKYIELIDDCILLTLDATRAHQLQALYPELQSLGYWILSAAKQKDHERSQLLGLNAMISNERFCDTLPWGRISVTDAASYLGLSRKTITVIRSRLKIK